MFVVIIFPQRSRRAFGSHRMVALSVCVCVPVSLSECLSICFLHSNTANLAFAKMF